MCKAGINLLLSAHGLLVKILKHKDSFGKSENLPKIFFAEILVHVFDHDYDGKSSSSNGLF